MSALIYTPVSATEEGRILYLGNEGAAICQKMVDLNYSGLSFESCFKALNWLSTMASEGMPLPVAIVCDASIAEEEASAFLESVRGHRKLEMIPFVLLANTLAPEKKAQALRWGADDVFPVTVAPEDLHYRIQFISKLRKVKIAERKARQEDSLFARIVRNREAILKRTLDIVASSVALLLLSPLFLIVALIIKIESRGSVFYISKRAGRGYQVFDFYKFRSMRQGADAELQKLKHLNQYAASGDDATFFKLDNDPRVTRFGQFLRKSSIDELPQLLNVLKGDMSIVGNRPLPLYEAAQLTRDQWAERFAAPAGITGLWQTLKRGKKDMSNQERIELDVEYARSASFMLDLKIILKTFPALMQKENV